MTLDRDKLDKIEQRYGEDFADAISWAVQLYLDPEQPDVDHLEDMNYPDSWDLRGFLNCFYSQVTDPTITQMVEQLRHIEKGEDLPIELQGLRSGQA